MILILACVCVGLVLCEDCESSESFLHCVLRYESTSAMVGICRSVWNRLLVL